jgi:enoyl-CoA hydratase
MTRRVSSCAIQPFQPPRLKVSTMVTVEVSDQIATLALSFAPVNALSLEWNEQMHHALDTLEGRSDWKVLRLRSTLRVFSAGGDIKVFTKRLSDPNAGRLLGEEAAQYQELFFRIERMSQVSIAEIAGVAAGGGLELALACDLRIASESARLGLPEVGLGLLPAAGGTQRLTRRCGAGWAMRLIGGSELISAKEAHQIGLVEWVFPTHEFDQAASAVFKQFAQQPAEALLTAKRCIKAALSPGDQGYVEEKAAPARLMQLSETRERLEAFVAAKSPK